MSASRSQLRTLANNYFNPDYDLDAPDPEGIVRKFADAETRLAVEQLVDEVVDVLARQPGEAELKRLWLDTYDSYFEPDTIGLTYREWFVRMLEILRAPEGGTG